MLQEEYLFLRRKDINGVADIVTKIGLIEFDIKKLTEKQKTLYQERADLKRKCVTDNNILDFYTSEPEYRKQLEDIKSEKKKLQGEKYVAERCLKESLYVGLLVPENVEIGNVYEVDVPKKPWYLWKKEKKVLDESQDNNAYATQGKASSESINGGVNDSYVVVADNEEQKVMVDYVEEVALTEEEAPIYEDSYEEADYVSETEMNTVDSKEHTKIDTKETYEAMTDKEKAEWIGIDSNEMLGSIKQFHEKLKSIGITYQYISDETEEYCRLEEAIKKNGELSWHYRNLDKKR